MKFWILFLALLCATAPANAWEGHFLMTYTALKELPEIANKPPVVAETLADFVTKEKVGLAKLLNENEQWSLQHVPTYPTLPNKLTFTGVANPHEHLRKQFLESIQINPDLFYPLFLQSLPDSLPTHHPLPAEEAMIASLVGKPAIRI